MFVSKATSMLTSMITDKTKNIKNKTATISDVRPVWVSICSKSVIPNTDQMSCLDVFNKLEMINKKENMDKNGQFLFKYMLLLRYGYHSVLKGAPCRVLRLFKISTCILQFIFKLILMKMARYKRCKLLLKAVTLTHLLFYMKDNTFAIQRLYHVNINIPCKVANY